MHFSLQFRPLQNRKIIEQIMMFKGFRENRVFEEDAAWKAILDGTWVDLGAQKGPK